MKVSKFTAQYLMQFITTQEKDFEKLLEEIIQNILSEYHIIYITDSILTNMIKKLSLPAKFTSMGPTLLLTDTFVRIKVNVPDNYEGVEYYKEIYRT